jgi:hypothetical protein
MYLDKIIPQQPLEAQGFEIEVPSEISEFANESFIHVDDRISEQLGLTGAQKGEVDRGYELLTSISD